MNNSFVWSVSKEKFKQAYLENSSYFDIATNIGYSRISYSTYRHKINLDIDLRSKSLGIYVADKDSIDAIHSKNKVNGFTDQEFIEIYKDANSYYEIALKLGYRSSSLLEYYIKKNICQLVDDRASKLGIKKDMQIDHPGAARQRKQKILKVDLNITMFDKFEKMTDDQFMEAYATAKEYLDIAIAAGYSRRYYEVRLKDHMACMVDNRAKRLGIYRSDLANCYLYMPKNNSIYRVLHKAKCITPMYEGTSLVVLMNEQTNNVEVISEEALKESMYPYTELD